MAFGKMGARGGFGSLGVLGSSRVYQGQVMTGSRWPQFLANPQVYFNSQSPHFAVDSGSRLKIVLSNAYAIDSTTNTGNITYTAAIWSGSGSTLGSLLGQFTFGGSTSGVCAPGALLESDWLPLNYTKGSQYLIRLWGQGAGPGIPFYQSQNGGNMDTAHGNQYENSSTSLADKTTSGATITTASAKNSYTPVAIIGDTLLPSVACIGDSLTNSGAANAGDTFDGTSPRLGFPDRVLGTFGTNGYAGINLGFPGEKASQFTNSVRALIARTYCSHVWNNYGINDIAAAVAASTVFASLQAHQGYFPGKRYVQGQVGYETTSTDSFITETNQTAKTGFAVGAAIDTLNSLIAGMTGVTGISDHRSAVFNLANNKWLADGSTTFWHTPDGTHFNQTGSKLIASSGVVPASLFTR